VGAEHEVVSLSGTVSKPNVDVPSCAHRTICPVGLPITSELSPLAAPVDLDARDAQAFRLADDYL
jgi:hypothetical protein